MSKSLHTSGMKHVVLAGRAEAGRLGWEPYDFPKARAARAGMGEFGAPRGEIGFTSWNSPLNVRAIKERLNGVVETTEAVVKECKETDLSPSQREGWEAFHESWTKFYKADDSWFLGLGTGALMDEAQAYEAQINQWAGIISTACHSSIPTSVSRPDNWVQNPETAKEESKKGVFGLFGNVVNPTNVGIALAITGVAAVVITYLAVRNHPVVRAFR